MKKSDHAIAYFNFIETAAQVEKKIKIALRPYGLTHAQLNVLSLLSKQPMTPNEIKVSLVVGSPDVTRMLDRLCQKGYVKRETSTQSRRQVDVWLSDEGKAVLRKAHLAAKRSVGNYFKKQISEQEARKLNQILLKIKDL